MEEGELISVDMESKCIRLSWSLRAATYFDICDINGRIIHTLISSGNGEYDLSFLPPGRYLFCTVCEGEPRKFYFSV